MRRAKTSGHKTCSSVVVAHLNATSSSIPSHPFFSLLFLDREPGRGYVSIPPTKPHAHYELHVLHMHA